MQLSCGKVMRREEDSTQNKIKSKTAGIPSPQLIPFKIVLYALHLGKFNQNETTSWNWEVQQELLPAHIAHSGWYGLSWGHKHYFLIPVTCVKPVDCTSSIEECTQMGGFEKGFLDLLHC